MPRVRSRERARESAGLLLYRRGPQRQLDVILGHPGGPFWAAKDEGAWSIPKGEVEPGEDRLDAARRETREETGLSPEGPFESLGEVVQKSGKVVHAWAAMHDSEPEVQRSALVTVEWPPRSGKQVSFPEIDRLAYFPLDLAREKLNPAQVPLLDRLVAWLAAG